MNGPTISHTIPGVLYVYAPGKATPEGRVFEPDEVTLIWMQLWKGVLEVACNMVRAHTGSANK